MAELNELIVIEPDKALAVFTTDKAIDPYLKLVKAEIDKHVPDVSTKKGRDAIASLAYKVAQVKSAVDKIGKELKDEQKKIPDLIDSQRNYAKNTLQAWQDEVRKPLTDWEEKEAARVDFLKRMLQHIIDCGNGFIGGEPQPFPILLRELEDKITIDSSWDEFEAEAHKAKEAALTKIRAAFEEAQKRAAEQAELEELRRQKAEREAKEEEERRATAQAEYEKKIRQEAAERARIEAEAKAEVERQAAARKIEEERLEALRKEAEHNAAIERANREKAEAEVRERQAKIDAENAVKETEARIKREQEAAAKKEQEELERRERNKKHAAKINNEAMQDFIKGGLSEEAAKLAVTLIAKKEISHVQINY